MKIFAYFFTVILFSTVCFSQIPTDISLQIVKAEDERRFDSVLENLLQNKDEKIRERAILAIGRIGDERGLDSLTKLLFSDTENVQKMSAFAIGEIESIKGADAILKVLADKKTYESVRVRAIEAAGKIAAANAKNDKSKQLSEAILENLRFESGRRSLPSEQVITFGLTAVLRARPENAETVIGKFLTYSSPKVRQNTLNTLARLRTKNGDINKQVHEILLNDKDAICRANACRILGTSEDKSFVPDLLKAALIEKDSRVRVSAIRALGNFKDKEIGEKLTLQGETLLKNFKLNKMELLEIATTLGRIFEKADNQPAIKFLKKLRESDIISSSETEIAFAKISPKTYINLFETQSIIFFGTKNGGTLDWKKTTSVAQGLGVLFDYKDLPETKVEDSASYKRNLTEKEAIIQRKAKLTSKLNDISKIYKEKHPDVVSLKNDIMRIDNDLLEINKRLEQEKSNVNNQTSKKAETILHLAVIVLNDLAESNDQIISKQVSMALPDILGVFARFKNDRLSNDLFNVLSKKDEQIRATAASLLADLPTSKANFDALNNAFDDAFLRDKDSNDAMLAIMDALFKVNPKDSLPVIFLAFSSDDYLVRKKAFEIFKKDDSEYAKAMIERAISQGKDKVLPYKKGSKQGVILNTNADYLRAISRKNTAVKAVFTTEKGTFTINLMPEDAPLTVDSFIKLARKNYFNGLTVHRVVPNFVMQDGDPRGDGNGGPGYSIRCEVNMLEYERGAVGMALSGKDTGGSQWFVTHSPQPHLDGGYTVFGKVNETDMKIVDTISRGDKILKVVILETAKNKRLK